MLFSDRADAGRRLARRLGHLSGEGVVVVGLPRGGVPVAAEVAAALGAPLDVIVVRKLGVPFQPEVAMGALGEGGVLVLNQAILDQARVSEADLQRVEAAERAELERRVLRFRGGAMRAGLAGRTVVVVDDGIATGATARAACQVARAQGAARVVLAVPVAPPGWEERLRGDADELVAVVTPPSLQAIGQAYADFTQVPDDLVLAHLRRAAARRRGEHAAATTGGRDVLVACGAVELEAELAVPAGAAGLVAFAHGAGSGRRSPRNRHVAAVLRGAGIGTLLLDLLTAEEAADRARSLPIELLGQRLLQATRWLRAQPGIEGLPVGCLGASTGAAVALWAASQPGSGMAAVVSRGGRPDLAEARLPLVAAPTLLIVGGADEVVLDINRRAEQQLRCPHRLVVVPGATHLFDEPGALDAAAELARDWFVDHLATAPGPSPSPR